LCCCCCFGVVFVGFLEVRSVVCAVVVAVVERWCVTAVQTERKERKTRRK